MHLLLVCLSSAWGGGLVKHKPCQSPNLGTGSITLIWDQRSSEIWSSFCFVFNLRNDPVIWPDGQYGGWQSLPGPFSSMEGLLEQGQGLIAAQEEPCRLVGGRAVSLWRNKTSGVHSVGREAPDGQPHSPCCSLRLGLFCCRLRLFPSVNTQPSVSSFRREHSSQHAV